MGFDHGAFQVSDIRRAVDFYVDKLGFTLDLQRESQEVGEAMALVTMDGATIELIQDLKSTGFTKPRLAEPFCPHLCFSVDDVDVMVGRLRDKGVPIVKGPLEIAGEEKWVYFADPDNNVLEFITWYHRDAPVPGDR